MTPMQEIKQRLIELGVPPEHIIGCTEAQIAEIMQAQGVSRLPEIYLDFLRVMGQGAGQYLYTEFYYPMLLCLKQQALELLEFERTYREDPCELPEDAFVFFMDDQAYGFYFFHTAVAQKASFDADFCLYLDQKDKAEFEHHESLHSFFSDAVKDSEKQIPRNPTVKK